ncbi:MAG TPA: hypothetical protein ENN46_00355 [Candidatus Woesearchaeota archaeon]|nr:hypothetical protein [Candidatus Woesearchaeota archaeon]
MRLKNKFVKWWVQNLLSKKFTRAVPGFIVTNFDNFSNKTSYRLLLLPEDIFVNIENRLVDKSEKYKESLVKLGEDWGYNFAYLLSVPVYTGENEKALQRFISSAYKYGLTAWVRDVKYLNIDLRKGEIRAKSTDFVIARKNRMGLILYQGCIKGLFQYVFNKKIEITSIKLSKDFSDIEFTMSITDKRYNPSFKYSREVLSQYREINAIRPLSHFKEGGDSAIYDKVFKTEDGLFYWRDYCLIYVGCIVLYLLESRIKEKQVLFDIGFDWGKEFFQGENLNFFLKTFVLFGFGDVAVIPGKTPKVVMKYFPWEPLEKDVNDFSLVRGILSGALSSVYSKEIHLKKTSLMKKHDLFEAVFQ